MLGHTTSDRRPVASGETKRHTAKQTNETNKTNKQANKQTNEQRRGTYHIKTTSWFGPSQQEEELPYTAAVPAGMTNRRCTAEDAHIEAEEGGGGECGGESTTGAMSKTNHADNL